MRARRTIAALTSTAVVAAGLTVGVAGGASASPPKVVVGGGEISLNTTYGRTMIKWATDKAPGEPMLGFVLRWRNINNSAWSTTNLTVNQAKAPIPGAAWWNREWQHTIAEGYGYNAMLPVKFSPGSNNQIQLAGVNESGQGPWFTIRANTPKRITKKAKLKFHAKYTGYSYIKGWKRYRGPAGIYATISAQVKHSIYYWKKPGSKKWVPVNYYPKDGDGWSSGSYLKVKKPGIYRFKRVAANKFGVAPAGPTSKIKVTRAMLKKRINLGTSQAPWGKYA